MTDTSDQQKTVLVGVTGCIGAYKACELVRQLQKAGMRVKVVMTEHATHFVDPLTFRSLTHEPVAVGLFDDPSDPIHHISLAEEAELFIIAPATANVIAKLAAGIADDLLTTTALACTCPLLVAPAMNVHMYENAITQCNMETLRTRGIEVIEPESGYLACGDIGKGRLPEPDVLTHAVLTRLNTQLDLLGKKILITAGPTKEAIDPVRFISNNASGKSGFALAEAAAKRGAEVTLVAGPVHLTAPANVQTISVTTALEMLHACEQAFETADIAIFSAAVCDLRPVHPAHHKLKKGSDDDALSHITFAENPDIIATLAAKKHNQIVIGYAAETDDVITHAKEKLIRKHADMIIANDVSGGKGFTGDDNQVTFVTAQDIEPLPLMLKSNLAHTILDKARALLDLRTAAE